MTVSQWGQFLVLEIKVPLETETENLSLQYAEIGHIVTYSPVVMWYQSMCVERFVLKLNKKIN